MSEINPTHEGGVREYQYLDENGQMISDYDFASHNALGASFNGNSTNVFSDWLFPQTKEARQNAAQLEMEKLTPQYKMAGMRAAGINPLTAAAGIAGSSSSPSQPGSSVNPLGDVASAVGSVAEGFNAVAGGVSSLGKLGSEIDNIDSSTRKNFADIGLTSAQTEGVMTDNKYRDDDWIASLNVKRQQFENMKEEWNNLKATHEEINKHIAEMQSQIELNGSQADYLDSFKSKLDEETRWIKAKNDFCVAHNLYLLESGLDGYIFSMIESGADMSQFDKFVDVYSKYRGDVSYATQRGHEDANIDTAYKRQYNEAKAIADVNADFRPYLDFLDELKALYMETIHADLENPQSFKAILGKLSNLLSSGIAYKSFFNSMTDGIDRHRPSSGNSENSSR